MYPSEVRYAYFTLGFTFENLMSYIDYLGIDYIGMINVSLNKGNYVAIW